MRLRRLGFIFIILFFCSFSLVSQEDFNSNERELIVKILELPIWNFDLQLSDEYLELVMKNSNIKALIVYAPEGSVFIEKINSKFNKDGKLTFNKIIINGTKIITQYVLHDDKEIAKVEFYY